MKGEKCSSNCTMDKKRGKNPPGQHGTIKSKMSDYGKHLREKQKARRIYGLTEEQFRHHYDEANKIKKGITGENFLRILELRLDNVVYRAGLAASRKQARQMVNHGNVVVDGKKTTVPRYKVAVGSKITVGEKYKASPTLKKLLERTSSQTPSWISFDKNAASCTLVSEPLAGEFSHPIDSQLIVEYYSK
ncbi:MAG: 30S ribosomal protein S4 [Elusimicrobia bacterium]|nr:30S ribosomal protein S4 [Elusimicrobiota bacterium]